MKIAFIPSSKEFLNNNIFDINFGRDNCFEPFSILKEALSRQNIKLDTYDLFDDFSLIDILIVFRFENNYKTLLTIIRSNPSVKIIFLVTEEQNIAPLYIEPILRSNLFDAVLTWRDDMIDNRLFFKYDYPNPLHEMVKPIEFNNKKYLTIINAFKFHKKPKDSDLYVERLKIIKYFSQYSEIDLFGIGWDRCKDNLVKNVYLGPVDSKIETLKKYKYAIAFENSNNDISGITEKIFDVMAAGCVPIYYGVPNVTDLIPKETFIDYRDFENLDELNEYLDSIDEKGYNEYMTAIKQFMESDAYVKFTSKGFVESVRKAIDYVNNKPPEKKSIASIKLEFFKKMFRYPKLFWNAKRFSFDLVFK